MILTTTNFYSSFVTISALKLKYMREEMKIILETMIVKYK